MVFADAACSGIRVAIGVRLVLLLIRLFCFVSRAPNSPARLDGRDARRSTFPPSDLFRGLRFERAYQPRNNHFLEDARVRPHSNLSSKVTTRRIDPRRLRHVAVTVQQVD